MNKCRGVAQHIAPENTSSLQHFDMKYFAGQKYALHGRWERREGAQCTAPLNTPTFTGVSAKKNVPSAMETRANQEQNRGKIW